MQKVLIANRGEIALRIQRTCHELGLKTVAVHSDADADAMHVKLANESVCIGAAPLKDSYLNIPNIISAAELTGADAIHPGYGILSESAKFAEIVEAHNLIFIGPSSKHIEQMGDKITAKKLMVDAGLDVIPGSKSAVTRDNIEALAEKIGYPVLLKASGGGGGVGMSLVKSPKDLMREFENTSSQAKKFFNNDEIYMEKYLINPRHIEVQIVADKHGNIVHLGERDCSIQRRNQKILEEAPSPILSNKEREYIGTLSVNAMKAINYHSLGTLEFLYENNKFYFIEMNTRIQVEHTITEEITDIDLVEAQINIAQNKRLGIEQEDIKIKGHAMQCRITCEDPDTLVPEPGKVIDYHPPGGKDVRVDSGLYAGYFVPPYYDSMISKLITYGINRDRCINSMKRALHEYIITGISNTIPTHVKILEHDDFKGGKYDIHWLEDKLLDI